MMDATQRFSSRIENYRKYRPGYPSAMLETLRREYQLTAGQRIADIGSGTGLLTELFLQNGNVVFAVEPNREWQSSHSFGRGTARQRSSQLARNCQPRAQGCYSSRVHTMA